MATKHGFVDRTAELEFILTHMDGKSRCDLLEITERHYSDTRLAERWYSRLRDESRDCSLRARDKLRDIFERMTD